MSESAIDRRIRAGRLHNLHPGVYAVGHRVVPHEGLWLAAVLRGGSEAVLSHRSAAALWGVLRRDDPGWIDISTPRKTRPRGEVRQHCLRLAPSEVTLRRRIPVTTLTRTLFDIAADASVEGLEAAIREAEYLHRLRVEDLGALLERHPGQRGAKTFRTCLHRLGLGPRGRTRSKLEVRFAALLARTNLPMPQLNTILDLDGWKIEADCLWSSPRVIVELDGGKAHGTQVAFEADRERDRRLQVAGWRVVRITWRQMSDPDVLVDDLHKLLGSRESASAVA